MPQEEAGFSSVRVLARFWNCMMLFYKMAMLQM
jgi:hypothetical protein